MRFEPGGSSKINNMRVNVRKKREGTTSIWIVPDYETLCKLEEGLKSYNPNEKYMQLIFMKMVHNICNLKYATSL